MQHILNPSGYEVLLKEIVRGENCYLYDASNRRYIDFESGVWCTALGHNHQRVNQAVARQMEQINHLGYRYSHKIVEEAAVEIMCTLGIVDGKCMFLSSGSEAVELGVQIARRLSGQPLLLSFKTSYLAAYGSAGRRSGDEWYFFDWNVCTTCPNTEECSPQCGHLQGIPFERIGGMVFEPGNSSGLVKLPPKQLIKALAQMIKDREGLIVVDEVTTGVGRTGTWYGYEHYDLKPDIIAIGKGIGNGYPVSAVALREEVSARVEQSGLRYAQSHQNDAWGAAIAKEVIAVVREEGLIQRSQLLGSKFIQQLEQLKVQSSQIKEVRGRGLMLAMEFTQDEGFSLAEVHHELLAQSYLVGYSPTANLLRFYPALTIKEDDFSSMVKVLTELLHSKHCAN